jgi:hypothetical protein
MKNRETGATKVFVRDEEGLFSDPFLPEPKTNQGKAIRKLKTLFRNEVRTVSKTKTAIMKVEHLAAEDSFSSDALLIGVDEADIKEDIKVGSDVNDQSCLKKDIKERLAADQDDDQGGAQRLGDNPMGTSLLLPGVKSHYGEENEDCLEPNAEQIFRNDALLARVDDSGSDESTEEEDEEVAPVNESSLTPEVAKEDPEPEVRNPRDDFKSESKLYASANHVGSHKAEALKDMGKARVAT